MTMRTKNPKDSRLAGAMTRRELLVAGLAATLARPAAALAGPLAGLVPTLPHQGTAADSALPIRVSTLNHVSFGCADLRATVAWYEKVLAIPRHAFQDYGGGQTVLRVAKDPPAYMALSQRSPETLQAPPTRRPHFCWGIEDFNVHRIFEGLAQMPALARSVLREGTTINGVNFDGPDGAPLQFNPIIACGGLGFLGEVCDTDAEAVRRPGDPPPVPGPDAEPHQVPRNRPVERSGVVPAADRHAGGHLAGAGGRAADRRATRDVRSRCCAWDRARSTWPWSRVAARTPSGCTSVSAWRASIRTRSSSGSPSTASARTCGCAGG